MEELRGNFICPRRRLITWRQRASIAPTSHGTLRRRSMPSTQSMEESRCNYVSLFSLSRSVNAIDGNKFGDRKVEKTHSFQDLVRGYHQSLRFEFSTWNLRSPVDGGAVLRHTIPEGNIDRAWRDPDSAHRSIFISDLRGTARSLRCQNQVFLASKSMYEVVNGKTRLSALKNACLGPTYMLRISHHTHEDGVGELCIHSIHF